MKRNKGTVLKVIAIVQHIEFIASQKKIDSLLNKRLSFAAERQGFEPWSRFPSGNGFRDRPIQPLWHLSKNN